MPPPSKIDLLPEDVRAELDQRLIKAAFGSSQVLSDWLLEQGFEISKTTVNDRARKLKRRMAAIQTSTEAAKAIVKAAPDEGADRSGSIMALLQGDIFEILVDLEEAAEEEDKMKRLAILGNLAKNVSPLVRASIAREQHSAGVRREATEAAAKNAVTAGQELGISDATIEKIRDRILKGIT